MVQVEVQLLPSQVLSCTSDIVGSKSYQGSSSLTQWHSFPASYCMGTDCTTPTLYLPQSMLEAVRTQPWKSLLSGHWILLLGFWYFFPHPLDSEQILIMCLTLCYALLILKLKRYNSYTQEVQSSHRDRQVNKYITVIKFLEQKLYMAAHWFSLNTVFSVHTL